MDDKRTPAWWSIRVALVAGIAAVVLALLALERVLYLSPMSDDERITLGPLEMGASLFATIAALAIAVVGLVWMVRIFRGPRDEPPPWRYRDH